MSSFEEIQRIEAIKKKAKSEVENDGIRYGYQRLAILKNKRGGKFKLSEKQFVDELATSWVSGEFSAAERILRCIELDPELNTSDLINGELHMMIVDFYEVLKKRSVLVPGFELGDLIDGKYSTKAILEMDKLLSEAQKAEAEQ